MFTNVLFNIDVRTNLEHYDSNELITPVINPYQPMREALRKLRICAKNEGE